MNTNNIRYEKRVLESKTSITSLKNIERKWYFIDLESQILGRVAVRVANLLRGKQKPVFINNSDLGDYVVLINSNKLNFTGKKLDKKIYYNHSGYPGGLRHRSLRVMSQEFSKELVARVVKGMLPKNKLSKHQLTRLFVFKDENHTLRAQSKHFIKI